MSSGRNAYAEAARLAVDVMKAHRLRSSLLILGVAIGVAVLGCIVLFFSPDPIYRMMEGVIQ